MNFTDFAHYYYIPPGKEGEPATVLCMRCAVKIKGVGVSKEEAKERYREKKIHWMREDGVRGDGVLILCPACVDLGIPEEYFPSIHEQIMKGLEAEAEWAKIPMNTDLKNMKIISQEAI